MAKAKKPKVKKSSTKGLSKKKSKKLPSQVLVKNQTNADFDGVYYITDKPIFSPDKELVAFAKWFSERFRKLKAGDYYSKTKKYHIKYWNIVHDGEYKKTTARSAQYAQRFEVNKRIVHKSKNFTKDFIFFLIIWCRAVLEDEQHRYYVADQMATEYYLTTKRSRTHVLLGWISQFKLAGYIEGNKQRLQWFIKALSHNVK